MESVLSKSLDDIIAERRANENAKKPKKTVKPREPAPKKKEVPRSKPVKEKQPLRRTFARDQPPLPRKFTVQAKYGAPEDVSNKIDIENLPLEVSWLDLKRTFTDDGLNVTNVEITGAGRASITFATQADAHTAVREFDRSIVQGREISVRLSRGGNKSGLAIIKRNTAVRPNKIKISNVPYNAGEDDLKNVFAEVGRVRSCKMGTERRPNGEIRNAGWATIEFTTHEEALAAKDEFDGAEMNGRTVRIELI